MPLRLPYKRWKYEAFLGSKAILINRIDIPTPIQAFWNSFSFVCSFFLFYRKWQHGFGKRQGSDMSVSLWTAALRRISNLESWQSCSTQASTRQDRITLFSSNYHSACRALCHFLSRNIAALPRHPNPLVCASSGMSVCSRLSILCDSPLKRLSSSTTEVFHSKDLTPSQSLTASSHSSKILGTPATKALPPPSPTCGRISSQVRNQEQPTLLKMITQSYETLLSAL